MQQEVLEIIEQFELLQQNSFEDAVSYLLHHHSIVHTLHKCLRVQIHPKNFMQQLFEWLYKCVQRCSAISDLFGFVVQFVPDLLLAYLHAVYENQTQLKASAEVLLLALILETEKDKLSLVQVPPVSKASIYHQSAVQVATPAVLTEAALKRHDQTETQPVRHSFTGKEVTVNNRLLFLSTVVDIFVDHLMVLSPSSQFAFCEDCIVLAMKGMGKSCIKLLNVHSEFVNTDELESMKRISVSDPLVTSLLRGVRLCMFQSCHEIAMQALCALKLRSEYEVLTNSIQISQALSRMAECVIPARNELAVAKLSCYHGEGNATFVLDPAKVHSLLNNDILYHKLSTYNDNRPIGNTAASERSTSDVTKAAKVTSV